MKRQRAMLGNESIITHHYNTRSSSRHESRGISNTDRDAIVATTSAPLRVTRRRKTISDDRSLSLDLLPIDLVMEILKRLPVKTLARLLCVSKLWASIIRRRDFMKLFLAESSTRPGRFFLSFMRGEDCFIFSSLETQTPGDTDSIATYNVKHPANSLILNSSSVHGLICYGNASGSGLVVYNSTTRRSITLPEFEPGSIVFKHFMGYDPIDGVYKVLCITAPRAVFLVLTLGNENSWKVIKDSHARLPTNSSICINGVVYYEVLVDTEGKESSFMSFDVRSEKFDHIKGPGGTDYLLDGSFTTLIKYEGKLAITSTGISANGSIALWVLEDAVKHKWLKKVFVLPSSWTSLVQPKFASSLSHRLHRFVHVTDAGELILAQLLMRASSYYVLCYDPKTNSVRKVKIKGIAGHKLLRCRKPCFFVSLL